MDIQKYLNDIVNVFFSNDPFIDVDSENISDIYLSEFHQEDETEDYDSDDLEEDDIIIEDQVESAMLPITKVIEENKQVVIIGDPGSGKSTILRYLARTYAKDCIDNGIMYVPFFIALKDLKSETELSGIFGSWENDNEIAELLENDHVFVLFDGLNELDAALYDTTMSAISAFRSRHEDVGIVLTSRKYGYHKQLDIPEYEIHEFSPSDIKAYMEISTGSRELYDRITATETFSENISNPLVLKMITEMWKKEHTLPSCRSELYSQYVDYQLKKSLTDAAEREEILSVLCFVAFDMRKRGVLAEPWDKFHSNLRTQYDQSVFDGIVKSGLICISQFSGNWKSVSFVHETFQEFLCAMYVAREYLTTGDICIDVYKHRWQETCKLMLEMMARKGDDVLIKALNVVRIGMEKESSGYSINIYLPMFVEECSGASYLSKSCNNYIQQYVIYMMEKYLRLPYKEKDISDFEIIIDSVLKLQNSSVYRLLFEEVRWLKEWLYSEDSIDKYFKYETNKLLHSKEKSLVSAIVKLPNKIHIYDELITVRDKYFDIPIFNIKLYNIINKLIKYFSVAEYKILYLRGESKFLYYTQDVAFIESQMEKLDAIPIDGFMQLIKGGRKDCISLAFRYIVPQLPDKSKQMALIREHIYEKHVQDVIFTTDYYSKYMPEILEICLNMEDRELSDTYFEYLQSHRKPLFLPQPTQYENFIEPVLIANTENDYLYILGEISDKYVHPILLQHIENGEYVKSFIGRHYVFRLNKCEPEGQEPVKTIAEIFGKELLNWNVEDNILTVYTFGSGKGITKASFAGRRLFIKINDVIYEYNYKSKKVPKFIFSHQPFYDKFIIPSNGKPQMYVMPNEEAFNNSNYQYYRPNEMLELYSDELKQFDLKTLLKLGLLGYMNDAIKKNLNNGIKIGCVKDVHPDKIFFYCDGNEIKLLGDYHYRRYRTGDLIIVYKKQIFKINMPERIPEFGYVVGKVRAHTNINALISVKGKVEYAVKDVKCHYSVGTKVSFFPGPKDRIYSYRHVLNMKKIEKDSQSKKSNDISC